jgi:glycosyltransferase involved in cell wall biosynthesis
VGASPLMRLIRVLHFARVINRHDFIDTVVRHADKDRFQMAACTLWARSNIADPEYAAAGISHTVIRGDHRWQFPWTAVRLARLAAAQGTDILHVHHYDEALIGAVATLLRPSVRLVVGRHYSDSLYRLSGAAKRRALFALQRLAYGRARRVVVPSSLIRDILLREGVPDARITLIPYGFDRDRYAPPAAEDLVAVRAELGLEGRFVVACFGRLEPQKGQQFLVDAAAQLRHEVPNLLVLLVGEGPGRAALETAIRERGLEDLVRLTGWRRDVPRIMASADVVAQPTLQEAFSQVMAEALWMGRPLVITPVGGVADTIRTGENGVVVPFAESATLARTIRELAESEPRRRSLGENGRAYAERALDIRQVIPRHERVYSEVFDER